MSLVKLIKSIF